MNKPCPSCGCTEDDGICTCRVCGDGTEDTPANPSAPYYQPADRARARARFLDHEVAALRPNVILPGQHKHSRS